MSHNDVSYAHFQILMKKTNLNLKFIMLYSNFLISMYIVNRGALLCFLVVKSKEIIIFSIL